jgi:hypothetical protein
MAGGYENLPSDALEQLKRLIQEALRRLDELERPSGSQIYDTLATLTALVNGLVTQTNVNVTGNVTAGGNFSAGGTLSVSGAAYFPEALANPVTSGYFAAYINGDTRLGRTVSSRRYKQNIRKWSPDFQAVFALQLVTFRQKAAVEELGEAAPTEWGLIAEELVELGLDWLVIFVDGVPEGIAYEKIALAILPVVQDHEARIRDLEARL